VDFLLHALGWLIVSFAACVAAAILVGVALLLYMIWQDH
jgi:hypothetical protein